MTLPSDAAATIAHHTVEQGHSCVPRMTNLNYINLLNTLSTNFNLSMEMLTNIHLMYGHGGNESMSLPCPSIQMPLANLVSMILYTIVCVVGLLGNTLVIYVVLRFSNMQVSHN